MCTLRELVWKCLELRPDRLNHDLQTLATLEGLSSKPDRGYDTSDEDGKVASFQAKGCPGEDGEVDAQNATHVAIQHCRDAHESMPNQNSENG